MSKKYRSGKLIAKNDEFIFMLLNDPLYRVNSDGTILTRVARTGRVFLDPTKWREVGNMNGKGYKEICYNYKKVGVHRVVYAKYGSSKLEEDLIINHKDGNRINNNIENLELITQKENCNYEYV